MLKSLKKAVKEDRRCLVFAKYDPGFENYWDDPDFIKIVGVRKKQLPRKRNNIV